jgi:hypothetical protein
VRTLSFKAAALVSLFLPISLVHVAPASAYEIYETGAFLNSSTLGSDSLGYSDGLFDDFSGSGIDLTFVNSLDSNGLGELTWQFINNTADTLSDVSLFGYVDGEIDETLNTFFNEYGQYISVTGSGSSDNDPDSWEIDEPGFLFGDIYDNLIFGALDNSNGVSLGSEDDVSVALGFELGDILAGQTWILSLLISEQDIGGLYHGDDDSGKSVYINGSAVVSSTAVPEPAPVLLFSLGLVSLSLLQRARLLRGGFKT